MVVSVLFLDLSWPAISLSLAEPIGKNADYHVFIIDGLGTNISTNQQQVDNCFKGPKAYLRKIFSNPTVEEKDGLLQLVYSIDETLLNEFKKQGGLYPVVTSGLKKLPRPN